MGQNHLPVCPLLSFLSHRFVQNPFGFYTSLFFYFTSYLNLYKMLVLTHVFVTKYITVGERTVALKIIARCSISQTPTEQSKVW